MGKGRKPCCDKAGVKRGPWSQTEDLKLMSFIQNHGHSNWRALPKLAGLARCGKSCRLRWVNYLRPDLKRGNFTPQEEEIIIKLHEVLGNKWSKIASHFPGRTDNEIKNVWNTHLKKRIKGKENASNKDSSQQVVTQITSPFEEITLEHSSSSSTCYSSQASFSDNQMSNFSSESDKGGESDSNMVENISDKDLEGVAGVGNLGMTKGDLVGEPIEIPFEPNLDYWDLLDTGEYSDSADSEVQYNEHTEAAGFNPISENDNKDYHMEDASRWWLVYLENELGLDHNESTEQAAFGNSISDELLFKEGLENYFQISPSEFT